MSFYFKKFISNGTIKREIYKDGKEMYNMAVKQLT